MLLQNPQLAYALLQAQVVMKIVDPVIAQVGFLTLQTVISACIFFIQHVIFKCDDIVFFWNTHLVFHWCFKITPQCIIWNCLWNQQSEFGMFDKVDPSDHFC